ncbi:uncharacterized protein LOC131598038 [Vicia villosa]|uniref:uncharacterized protein LOC131598038 n=1 Tax=Vicia villosa TaxID=3911 RepID=UPI00273B7D4F|nr:uncharacterized protein LOC131598038 [Vicia villosa]
MYTKSRAFGEGEWRRVTHKHRVPSIHLKWDVFPAGGRNRNHCEEGVEVSSFFIYDFPDFSTAKDLFELFGCIGRVVEVAISPRRNNRGRRFGFARFKEVEDVKMLGVRLDNVHIAGNKIHANPPRFVRGEVLKGVKRRLGTEGRTGPVLLQSTESHKGVFGDFGGRKAGRSYADVVQKANVEDGICQNLPCSLSFSSKEEDRKRFSKAYMGRVKTPGSAYNIQTHFDMEGMFAVKVSPMGGNMCLLEDREPGFIEDMIGEGESWWKDWFEDIRRWKDADRDESRVVWLRVFGIPPLVWNSEFFRALGGSLGEFIRIDEHTASGECFDVARVMVRVKLFAAVPDSLKVIIDDIPFSLLLKEDSYGSPWAFTGNPKTQNPGPESTDSDDSLSNDL